jgi:hypothetical protein
MTNKIEFLANLDDEFLECRDLRHAWVGALWFQEPDGTVIRVTKCARCETRREEVIDMSAQSGVASRTYLYPKGYQWHRTKDSDDARLSSHDVRMEVLERGPKMKRVKDRSEIHHA